MVVRTDAGAGVMVVPMASFVRGERRKVGEDLEFFLKRSK